MLAFLHSASTQIEVFASLLRAHADDISVRHEVRSDLLAAALAAGDVTPPIANGVEQAVRGLVTVGASVVVCTCSTLGAAAEATPVGRGTIVMRIDRAMAEAAVASGRRLVVVAAVNSALSAGVRLLQSVAVAKERKLELAEVLCAGAWAHFERGDRAEYAAAIAQTVDAATLPGDVVVLAQASMAPAAALVTQAGIVILSSPVSGVQAALEAHRTVGI